MLGKKVKVIKVNSEDENYFEVGFTGTVIYSQEGNHFVNFKEKTEYLRRVDLLDNAWWVSEECVVEVTE